MAIHLQIRILILIFPLGFHDKSLSHLLYSSTSTEISRVQNLEISRVQNLEISRICTLEISRRYIKADETS